MKKDVIFKTKSGKQYHIVEENESYICNRNGREIVVPKVWVRELKVIYDRMAASLDVILSAMEHEWYVAAEWRFMNPPLIVPVFGCDTEEECHTQIAKLFGNGWKVVHHDPIV